MKRQFFLPSLEAKIKLSEISLEIWDIYCAKKNTPFWLVVFYLLYSRHIRALNYPDQPGIQMERRCRRRRRRQRAGLRKVYIANDNKKANYIELGSKSLTMNVNKRKKTWVSGYNIYWNQLCCTIKKRVLVLLLLLACC